MPTSPIARRLAELMQAEGAYFTNEQETDALRDAVFHADGSINTAVVGKPAAYVAAYAGIRIPAATRILVTPLQRVGKDEPLSLEKLTTVLGWYEADGWETGMRDIDRHHRERRPRPHADHLCQR